MSFCDSVCVYSTAGRLQGQHWGQHGVLGGYDVCRPPVPWAEQMSAPSCFLTPVHVQIIDPGDFLSTIQHGSLPLTPKPAQGHRHWTCYKELQTHCRLIMSTFKTINVTRLFQNWTNTILKHRQTKEIHWGRQKKILSPLKFILAKAQTSHYPTAQFNKWFQTLKDQNIYIF